MSKAGQYRILTPQIIHETIDGEVVVVNLETGTYYSIDKAGAIVWSCIDHGYGIDCIMDHVALLYEGDRTIIEQGIQGFINNLEKENLIGSAELDGIGPAMEHAPPRRLWEENSI